MSLFGSSTQTATTKPNLFSFGQSTTTTSSQPSTSLFGTANNTQAQQQNKPLFNFGNTQPTQSATQPQQQGGSLFGNTQQQSSGGGLFGSATAQPQQSGGGLFGNTQPQQSTTGGGLFGSSTQQQQQQKPAGLSLFGGAAQSQPQQQQQQSGGFFGASTSQQQPQQNQQQQQRPLDQTLRFGQSQQNAGLSQSTAQQSLWEEGRGMGVHRSIPDQMTIVKDKWDPASLSCPLRTYVYQRVNDEAEALMYSPGPGEDANKWEEAVTNRPGPAWVPLLIRGFWELGKKAQIQMEAIQRCNMMLQEINASLDVQLDTHRQKVTTSLIASRKRHLAMSQRCLGLAVKVQILRNRGYVMDNAEEELKAKLEKLERDVFDPSLGAREQEIWARMLGIRERTKRLKAEMDKLAPSSAKSDVPALDEVTTKAAKETLEAYDTQLRHLHKELELVQQEYADWEKSGLTRTGSHNGVGRR